MIAVYFSPDKIGHKLQCLRKEFVSDHTNMSDECSVSIAKRLINIHTGQSVNNFLSIMERYNL